MAGFIVYELIDPTTDVVFYVGKGLRRRPKRHVQRTRLWMRKGCPANPWKGANLHKLRRIRLILTSGFEPDVHIVREFVSEDEALAFEYLLIAEHGIENLTNLTEGGDGVRSNPSSEVRAKISRAHKGKRKSPSHCHAISKGQRGRVHSPETRQKMREAKLGRKQAPRHIAKVAAANRGKKRSPEFCQLVSERNRGRKHSAETRERMSNYRRSIAKYPFVTRVCKDCGISAPHRQRKGCQQLVAYPRCVDCQHMFQKKRKRLGAGG